MDPLGDSGLAQVVADQLATRAQHSGYLDQCLLPADNVMHYQIADDVVERLIIKGQIGNVSPLDNDVGSVVQSLSGRIHHGRANVSDR